MYLKQLVIFLILQKLVVSNNKQEISCWFIYYIIFGLITNCETSSFLIKY